MLWAPLEIAEQAKSYLDRLPEVKGIYPLNAVLKNAEPFTRMELSQFDQGTTTMPSFVAGKEVPHVRLPVRSLQKFETEAKKAIAELAELSAHASKWRCSAKTTAKRQRFTELIEQRSAGLAKRIEMPMGICIADSSGSLHRHRGACGVTTIRTQSTDARRRRPIASPCSAITNSSTATSSAAASTRSSPPGRSIQFLDLKAGDYVVHVAHGIAQFMGMHQITKDGKSRGISHAALRRQRHAARPGRADQPDSEICRRVSAGIRSCRGSAAARGKSKRPRSPKPSWTWPPS